MYLVDENSFLRRGAGFLNLRTDQAILYMGAGGNNIVRLTATTLQPEVTNTVALGTATPLRWSNVFSVLGNYSGTLTTAALLAAAHNTWDIGVTGTRYRDGWFSRNVDIDGTLNVQGQGTFQANVDFAAGIDVTGNITVTGLVDTVDVAGHTHDVTGATAATQPALSGKTDNWLGYGSETWTSSIRTSAGTAKYIRTATSAAGADAIWEYMFVTSTPHGHALSGGDATAAVESHTHADGTLATGTFVNP